MEPAKTFFTPACLEDLRDNLMAVHRNRFEWMRHVASLLVLGLILAAVWLSREEPPPDAKEKVRRQIDEHIALGFGINPIF